MNLSADGKGPRPTLAVVWFWLLATSILIIATALTLWESRGREIQNTERHLASLNLILSEQTTRTFQSVDIILQVTVERLGQRLAGGLPIDPEFVNSLLAARASGATQMRSLFVVGVDGRVRYSALTSPIGISVGDRDYVAVHGNGQSSGFFISKPVRNRVDGEWSIFMSRRLETAQGEYAGVVAASIPLSYFNALYKSIKQDEGSSIALYLRDGTLLHAETHHVEVLLGHSYSDTEVFRALDRDPSRLLMRERGDPPRIIAFRITDDFPLVTTIALSEKSALAAWRDQAAHIVGGMVAVILLLAFAAFAIVRTLMREEKLAVSLRESQARLEGIIHSVMDAVITVDENGRIILFNPAAERLFGCTAAEAMGTSLDRFIPERYRRDHREYVARFGECGETARRKDGYSEIVALRANGEEVTVDASISRVSRSGKKLYTAVLRDITARLRREEELRCSNRQLRELSASLQTVREEERTRIARELHDDLGQQLMGLRMNLSWIGGRLREEETVLLQQVGSLQEQIDVTIGSVRRITSELRPLMLDDLGLFAAAGWLADDFAKKTGVEVQIDLDAAEPDLDDRTSSCLFRILQESLTNVARHADASCVWISLKNLGEHLMLRVEDDGRGMDVMDGSKPRSYGLIGIRERAYMFGGEVRIASQPGLGTTIEVTAPIAELVLEEFGQ